MSRALHSGNSPLDKCGHHLAARNPGLTVQSKPSPHRFVGHPESDSRNHSRYAAVENEHNFTFQSSFASFIPLRIGFRFQGSRSDLRRPQERRPVRHSFQMFYRALCATCNPRRERKLGGSARDRNLITSPGLNRALIRNHLPSGRHRRRSALIPTHELFRSASIPCGGGPSSRSLQRKSFQVRVQSIHYAHFYDAKTEMFQRLSYRGFWSWP